MSLLRPTRRTTLQRAFAMLVLAGAAPLGPPRSPEAGTHRAAHGADADNGISVSELARMRIVGIPRATAAEPLHAGYDAALAGAFLDRAGTGWTRQNRCGTCHTNLAYLMGRPSLEGARDSRAAAEVRTGVLAFAEQVMAKPGNRKPFLLAPATAAILVHDGRTGRASDPRVERLLAYLWTLQDADGGWSYGTVETLPFLESNPYYVSLLVALASGYAPADYFDTPAARVGMTRLAGYLRTRRAPTLHERAVLLWASARRPELLDAGGRRSIASALLHRQNRDGGWGLTGFGRWRRHDGAPVDRRVSDGYATGLAALALCSQGRDARDPAMARAVGWLRQHQRESGRWFTPSTYSDQLENNLSNMATAYAVMALDRCAVAA